MCLVFFSYKYPKETDFFIASNRDEFHGRKTLNADYWEDFKTIWGGKDLQAGGTWLGVENDSRFSFITNYRNFHLPKTENPISRGNLVKNFLTSNMSSKEYAHKIFEERNNFDGFNLVIGDANEAYYINNKQNILRKLEPGVYAVSNGILDEPWQKVIYLKSKLLELIHENEINFELVFQILNNRTQYSAENLPNTGIGIVKEMALSSCFIELENYGTRCSTVLLKKYNMQCLKKEKVYI